MSEIVFPSTKAGNEVDRAVTAALETIPAQLTQIGSKLDNLERVANSVGSLYVNNTYTITAGTIGGGNRTFTISDLGLAVGDNLIFRLNCSNGEVNRYRVITSNGKVPTRTNAVYYQPNVTYTISITNSEFVSASTFGTLVAAADALVSGTATVEVMVVHRNKIGIAEKLFSLSEVVEDVRYLSTEEALIEGYYIATGNEVGETAALQTYQSADYGYAIIDCMEGDIFTLTTYVNTAIAKAYTILDENNVILAFQQDSASNLQVTIPSGGVKIVVNSRIRSYAPSIIHTFSRFGRYEKEIEEIHGDISELDVNVNSKLEQLLAGESTTGKYITTNGTLEDDENWSVTDFIAVSSGATIEWKYGDGMGVTDPAHCMGFYNSSKVKVDYGISNSAEGKKTFSSGDYNANTAFVRASFMNSASDAWVKINGKYAWRRDSITDEIERIDELHLELSKIKKVSDSVGAVYLENTYTITEGAISGGNRTFNISDLNASIGDILIFKVTSNNGEIGRYIILTNGGKVPYGTKGDYYLPNRTYTISISVPEFLSSSKFGFYIKADDALAGGTVHAEMVILKKGVTLANYVLSLDDKINDLALHTGVISRSVVYSVSPSIASGSNNTFKTADFNLSLNDTITFKVTCDDGIINRFRILATDGKIPNSTSAYYQPNTLYTIEVTNPEFIAASKFGFYVNAQDALAVGSMRAEMVIVKRNSTDTPLPLAVRIATLEEDVAELEEQVGERDLPLSGKTVWTVGDSLFYNTWQSHFVDISGATWYAELNTLNSKPISWGGSNSSPDVDSGSQARAINLVSYKNDYDMDIVLFENINDRNLLSRGGSIDDVPFMRSQKISYPIGETLPTYTEVQSYVNENLSSIVSSIESNKRKRGTIISIPYTSGSQVRGSRITFLTTPTSEGDITINLNGAKSVHVTTGMTIQDIVDAFIQYSYGSGWTDVDNGDGSISIYYYTTTSTRATFDGGNTGVTARVEDTTGTGEYNLFFIGDGVSEWEDTTKWVTTLSLYSIYKGLIEYLKTELPESHLYFVFPFSVGVDFSATTYKHGDGTWSQDKFVESTTYATQKSLYDIQKECADFYGVPCLDLVANAGMNIINIETYFYTNNVHPKVIGYNRYADTILKLLK